MRLVFDPLVGWPVIWALCGVALLLGIAVAGLGIGDQPTSAPLTWLAGGLLLLSGLAFSLMEKMAHAQHAAKKH